MFEYSSAVFKFNVAIKRLRNLHRCRRHRCSRTLRHRTETSCWCLKALFLQQHDMISKST